MMFSGALQTFYYHSKAEDAIAVKGKKVDEQSDDADDEEELDIFAWQPPKNGTKRALKFDENDKKDQPRTAADDEYEQENDFANIDDMIKTAQQQGQLMLSSSLSSAERTKLESAGNIGTEQMSLNSTNGTVRAKGTPSIPATPASNPTSVRTRTPATPLTPFVDVSVSTPMSALDATAHTLNQVHMHYSIMCIFCVRLKHPVMYCHDNILIPANFLTVDMVTDDSLGSQWSVHSQSHQSHGH
jgi:hypothetical protein